MSCPKFKCTGQAEITCNCVGSETGPSDGLTYQHSTCLWTIKYTSTSGVAHCEAITDDISNGDAEVVQN